MYDLLGEDLSQYINSSYQPTPTFLSVFELLLSFGFLS